jgi:polyhydroxybutyrate depolymerase
MILSRGRDRWLATVAGVAMALAAPVGGPRPAAAQSVTTLTYQMPGGNRTVLVTDFAQGRPAPLVIVLHAAEGSSEQIRRYLTWDAIGKRERLLVVYPQGVRGGWNDGRPADGRRFNPLARVDDVGFIRNMVADLNNKGRIDRRRVYLIGVSAGGHMTNRLICEASDLFAAAAPLLATLAARWTFHCAGQPMPVLMVNGTEDPITPWGGRPGGVDPDAALASVNATFAFFRSRNGCASAGERPLPEQETSDNSRVHLAEGTGCHHATRLYRVEGGGHHTPTGLERRQRPPIGALLGQQNHDIETDEEIWAFFAEKRRP